MSRERIERGIRYFEALARDNAPEVGYGGDPDPVVAALREAVAARPGCECDEYGITPGTCEWCGALGRIADLLEGK